MSKKVNGNPNILTPEQEQMRQQVVDLELKARYWEAQWKIRFYTLEAEKLQPEYNDFLENEKKKQDEMIKRFQEQIDKMNQEAQKSQEEKLTDKILQENAEFLGSLDETKIVEMRADYPNNR